MYQTDKPYSFSCTAPGKVFLLGEYAVLKRLPAVILTVGPRFMLQAECHTSIFASVFETDLVVKDWDSLKADTVHPKTPLGRLMDWASYNGLPELKFRYNNPFANEGGFGLSSAEFVLAYWAYTQVSNWPKDCKEMLKLYRELTSMPKIPPSGADVVAQWKGGVVLVNLENETHEDLWNVLDWSNFLVFSASHQTDRKVKTHEHLEELSKKEFLNSKNLFFNELNKILAKGVQAILNKDYHSIGQTMNTYADVLDKESLELKVTHEDRLALKSLPDVLGVKGCGAMQSDAVVVLVKPGSLKRAQIIEVAQERGLKLICNGLTLQHGVCESEETTWFEPAFTLKEQPISSHTKTT
ncbi:MAG: hypothetical protein HY072_04185 [Deltaproteobacteria bacterium]|nr:hypothetical protein [Deltaproteobacteria bacterium]